MSVIHCCICHLFTGESVKKYFCQSVTGESVKQYVNLFTGESLNSLTGESVKQYVNHLLVICQAICQSFTVESVKQPIINSLVNLSLASLGSNSHGSCCEASPGGRAAG